MRGNQFFGKPITPRAHKFNSKKNKQPVPVCLKVFNIGITENRNIRRVHRATDLSIFRNRVQLRDILFKVGRRGSQNSFLLQLNPSRVDLLD